MKSFSTSLLGGLVAIALLFLLGFNSQNGVTILGPVDGSEFFITPPQWDDVNVDLGRTRGTGGGADADWDPFAGGTMRAYSFDAGSDEELYVSFQVPHSYKFATDMHCHMHWAASTTNVGTVRWCMDFTFQQIDSTYTSGTVARCIEGTTTGTAWVHQLTEFTPDVTGFSSVSAIFIARLYRDADASTGGTDTYTGDAFGLAFDCHIQKDTNGSRSEYIK